MPRRKPSTPTRRYVTGDGIGGRPPAGPEAAVQAEILHHPDAAVSGPSPSSPDGEHDLASADETIRGSGDFEGSSMGMGEGGDEAEEDKVEPSSVGGKRKKMKHQAAPQVIGSSLVGSRYLPLHPLGSFKEARGLLIVVPPPPGRAAFVRNVRVGRVAVSDDEDDDSGKERLSLERSKPELGVTVEFGWSWGAHGGAAECETPVRMMIRMDPETFNAIEVLDREGFIAFTGSKVGAPAVSCPTSLSSCSRPLTPVMAPVASRSSPAPSSPTPSALEFHLLSTALDENGPRLANVPKWKLVIAWLFPKTVEGFFRPVERNRGTTEEHNKEESPPSAAEILYALDAARSTDPDLRAAIQRGPVAPLAALPELVVNLRQHQKAAIDWMLGVEKAADAELSRLRQDPQEAHRNDSGAVGREGANEEKGKRHGYRGEEPSEQDEQEREHRSESRGVTSGKGGTTSSSERNASLLGWVRLALAPPVAAAEENTSAMHHVGGSNGHLALVGWGDRKSGHAAKAVGDQALGDAREDRREVQERAHKVDPVKAREGGKRREDDVEITQQNIVHAGRSGATTQGQQVETLRSGVVEDEQEREASMGSPCVLRAGHGHVWFHIPSARLAMEVPESWVAFSGVSGGILADEMGLGKTVEMLGCILANPYPSPGNHVGSALEGAVEIPGDRNGADDLPASPRERKSGYWDDLRPTDEGSACVCGRGDDEPLTPDDLCFVQCDSCGWWLHGGCCGYVPGIEGEDEREFTCVVCSCLALLKDPKRCGTTLIICPHKIRSQWEREIRTRTKPGALKVAVYKGVKEILSLGEKTKHASSRRINKRRLSAISNAESTSGSGTTGGTAVGGRNTKRKRKSSQSTNGGSSSTLEAEGPKGDDSFPRQSPPESDAYPIQEDLPLGGDEGRGTSLEPGSPHASRTAGPVAGRPDTNQVKARAVSSKLEDAACGGSGGSGNDVDSAGGAVAGDICGSNDPFALLSPSKLASFDVVLTTFEVLRAEVHHAESRFAGVSGNPEAGASTGGARGRPTLRRRKRYRVVPSPLPALQWWRVVVDEAHMVESTTQETAKMALKIPATHRWCVTGTPIGKGSIDDLYGLLVFLKAAPLDSKMVWEKTMREPIDRRLPGALERLSVALKQVMWRVTKASVAAQVNIPPQTLVDRRLSFSSVEEHFYRKQHRAATADAQKTAREGGRGTEEKMFNSLLALRQACCHPCIGSGGIDTSAGGSRLGGGPSGGDGVHRAGQGRWLSMDQILDRLIDEERLKAEEAQRKAILNLNASGAVARLILKAKERRNSAGGAGTSADASGTSEETAETLIRDSISSYRRALQMAEDNRTPGPVTGGAELTGSRTMLPPTLKRQQQAAKGAATTDAAATDAAASDSPAAIPSAAFASPESSPVSPTAPTSAVFVELRKPLVLKWNVVLGPNTRVRAKRVQHECGDDEEEAVQPNMDRSGVDEGSGEPAVPSIRSAEAGREAQDVQKARDNPEEVDVDVLEQISSEAGRQGLTGPHEGGGEIVYSKPRDPVWARLVFADRKRILRIRVRCPRDMCLHDSAAADSTRSGESIFDRTAQGDEDGKGADALAPKGKGDGKTAGRAKAVVVEASEVLPNDTERTCGGKSCGRGGGGGGGSPQLIWYPRRCVLQSSTQAGMFQDVVRFSTDTPLSAVDAHTDSIQRVGQDVNPAAAATVPAAAGGDDGGTPTNGDDEDGRGWQEVVVPPDRSLRGREWRIVVETCQVMQASEAWAPEKAAPERGEGGRGRGKSVARMVQVGMEVELREAEVDADSLQLLHAAHNLLEVIDEAKQRQITDRKILPVQSVELGKLVEGINASYVATAVGVHHTSKLQLREAGRAFTEAREAAARQRIGGLEWWEVALRYMEGTAEEGKFVERARLELLHEKAGQYGVMVRRSFPNFDSIGGLRMALSMKIKEAQTKRTGVLRKLESLSTDPGPMEVHLNSNCRRCRADWGKTGPICGHCKVEESIDAWEACVVYFRRPLINTAAFPGGGASPLPGVGGSDRGPGVNNAHQGHTFKEPSATFRLLRLIQRWTKEQARGAGGVGGGSGASSGRQHGDVFDWVVLGAESKDFLASWEAAERELLSSRALWRAHLDLLSNIDELASCVTPLRLADQGERLDLLTADQRRMVLPEGVLEIRRREYELERQASLHNLEVSRGQLAYLSTLVGQGTGTSASNSRECVVCQDDLVEEVGVLPCGHAFHPECIGFLRKVGSNGRFRCPTCRRPSSSSDVRFASNLDQSDGSAFGLPVKGSWGTKITALVGDILSLGASDKCLVFSQWDDMLDIVELAFKENQVSYARMKGKKRSEVALEAFRADAGPRVLMLAIKTGSHGLNLVEANHVFLLEPLLNAAVEAQAVNRVHRGGQTRPTTIHRFVVRGTIEEDIERLRNEKVSLSRLVNGAQSPTSKDRGKVKGKRKRMLSPARSETTTPAAAAAVGVLANEVSVQSNRDNTEIGFGAGAEGGTSTNTGDLTLARAMNLQQGEGDGVGMRGGVSAGVRVESWQEDQEEEEEDDEDDEVREGDVTSFAAGTPAKSERKVLSLEDLKALFK